MSSSTWQAALLSTGSIIEAVDKVMKGEARNAFCAVRPPGHHAGVFGSTFKNNACDQEQTNGFCYINNVAVAASYLKNVYRNQVKRVAIVDFDVHHGNGTQEIVECMQAEKLFKEPDHISILWDNDSRKSTVYKPWLDDEDGSNVLFQSVHLHGNNFYPNTGGFPAFDEKDIKNQEQYYPGGIYNFPIFPGKAKCSKWRKVFAEKVIPQLMEF